MGMICLTLLPVSSTSQGKSNFIRSKNGNWERDSTIFSYKANATRLSRLMRDELVSGKDLAVYWIEHVLRHKGSKHLQLAGKNLPFYQRHMIDVILFVAVVSMTMLALLVILLRCIVRKCFRRPATAKKNKTN